MKTLKLIILGLVLIISGISQAQVINININKDSTKTVNPPPATQPAPAATQPAPVQAPEEKEKTFYGVFGLRFMPTFSSLKLQSASGNTIKGEFVLSYGGGAILGLNYDNHIGLEAEVIYNNLSQKYKDQDLERTIHINYINIPVLLSLNTGRANAVNLNIVGGPQLGINVGSSISTKGGEGVDTVQAVLAVKKSDFGFAYGAGLDFGLNKSKSVRLDLGFRGVYGLININDKSKSIETNQYYILEKAHVETYSAYIGFLILF